MTLLLPRPVIVRRVQGVKGSGIVVRVGGRAPAAAGAGSGGGRRCGPPFSGWGGTATGAAGPGARSHGWREAL